MSDFRHISEIIPEILSMLGQGKERGNEYVCSCPFHDDRHPSFSVNIDTGVWYCFTCAEGGSIHQLAKRLSIEIGSYFKPSFNRSSLKLQKRINQPWQQAKNIEEAADILEDWFMEEKRRGRNEIEMDWNEGRISELEYYRKRQMLDYNSDHKMEIHGELRNRLTYEAKRGGEGIARTK